MTSAVKVLTFLVALTNNIPIPTNVNDAEKKLSIHILNYIQNIDKNGQHSMKMNEEELIFF